MANTGIIFRHADNIAIRKPRHIDGWVTKKSVERASGVDTHLPTPIEIFLKPKKDDGNLLNKII